MCKEKRYHDNLLLNRNYKETVIFLKKRKFLELKVHKSENNSLEGLKNVDLN